MKSRKILIITYYWPPSGGAGVQRWMNFAIQLKKRGWEPIVLTPENPQFEIKDEKLADLVSEIQTHKVPIWEPFDLFHKLTGGKDRQNVKQGSALEKKEKGIIDRLMVWIRGNLFIPDPRVFWVRPASKKAISLVNQRGIGTVITTGPPHSMHLIGRKVKKACSVKWIADFRDPWSKWDILDKLSTSSLARSLHKYLEQSVLKLADVKITVSPRMAEAFGGIEVVHNGVTLSSQPSGEPDGSAFTIGYFGMLNELRNPRQLWQLLDSLCRENSALANNLKVRIGGIISESVKDEMNSFADLRKRIEYLGYLDHAAVQNEYQRCNLLLLLQNQSDNSKWILPLKFFEYLAARRMILGLGERESDLGDLMNSRDIGLLLPYNDLENIRIFIKQVYEEKKKPNDIDTDDLLSLFSHQHLVQRLEHLIED